MKLKSCLLRVLAGGVIAALVAACAEMAPPSENPALLEKPAVPAPTPVPASATQAANEFAQAQALIEADWAAYHQDFDAWRGGLTSCGRNAAVMALRDLASGSSDTSLQVRDLPRYADTRDLADILVKAAEAEEEGFRKLSNQWQPGNISLFEEVDRLRLDSIDAQIAVVDGLEDLTHIDPDFEDTVEEFHEKFGPINDNWTGLQADYAEMRSNEATLVAAETTEELDHLLQGFIELRNNIEDLPSGLALDDLIDDLLEALDEQEAALNNLHDEFSNRKDAPPSPPKPTPGPGATPGIGDLPPELMLGLTIEVPPPGGSSPESGENAAPDQAETNGPSFDEADDAANASNEVLAETRAAVAELLEDPTSGLAVDLEKADEFEAAYLRLLDPWDRFHARYTGWRATDGGCDREEVAEALAGFSETLSGIASGVRAMPRDSFLRPMGNALIDAVQQEQEAMRVLGYDWRPFSTDAFRAFDQARSSSLELRRETEVGVDELLTRFGGG